MKNIHVIINDKVKVWQIIVHYEDGHDEYVSFVGTEEEAGYEMLAAGYTIEANLAGIVGSDMKEVEAN